MPKPEMPKADVESVLAEFDAKRDALIVFAEKTKGLIEDFLQYGKVRYQSVQARVKKKEKLKNKYLDPTKNYAGLQDITDQVALRIVTFYEDEVDQVAEIIKREFEIDTANSVDKREMEPDKFGYYALNFICKYKAARTSQVEYRKFSDIWCEIQITSILRHAWSEIEHPWYDLKDAFPVNIKRRFARMAALLEIAESEFLSLKRLQGDYQRSVDIQVEAKISDIAVDAVSMRSFIERDPIVSQIDQLIAAVRNVQVSDSITSSDIEHRVTAASLAEITTLKDLHELLERYRNGIPEFVHRYTKEFRPAPPPNNSITKGMSIHVLCMMLVASKGIEKFSDFSKAFSIASNLDSNSRTENIATEIVKKYQKV
jgi:putative GTP pyrophosphokinase